MFRLWRCCVVIGSSGYDRSSALLVLATEHRLCTAAVPRRAGKVPGPHGNTIGGEVVQQTCS
jgi:hypothetical protein